MIMGNLEKLLFQAEFVNKEQDSQGQSSLTRSRTLNLDALKMPRVRISKADFQNYDCDKKTTACETGFWPLPTLPFHNVKEYECKSNICKPICEKGYLK